MTRESGTYEVVRNGEGQYSLWPAGRERPAGWLGVGRTGGRNDCLDYIERVWGDIRPMSVRGADETVGELSGSGTPPDRQGSGSGSGSGSGDGAATRWVAVDLPAEDPSW